MSSRVTGGALGIWAILVLTLPLHSRLPIGAGREIGLSLFDLALPTIWLIEWARGKTALDRRIAVIAGGAACLVLAHAVAFWALQPGIELNALIRETAKYVGFIVMVAMATMLFSDVALRRIPVGLIGVTFVFIAGWSFSQAPAFANTLGLTSLNAGTGVYPNVVVGLLVLMIFAVEMSETRRRWSATLLVGIGAFWITSCYLAKSLSAVVLAIGIAALLRHAHARLSSYHRWVVWAILAGITASAITISNFIFVILTRVLTSGLYHIPGEYPQYVVQSENIRAALWGRALDLFAGHPVLGIGLGQFGAQPAPIADVYGLIQLYVHNTPLAMACEMGLLGVLLGIGLVWLGAWAIRALPWLSAIAVTLYFGASFLLNDGVGYRAAILILGFALARQLATLKRSEQPTASQSIARG